MPRCHEDVWRDNPDGKAHCLQLVKLAATIVENKPRIDMTLPAS
jgi:hypothetical protein